MFLLVQNPGVAPVEGFTLLGVSTTRDCGVAGTIGQFGSGAKHAINTLLRAGLKLLIYCGKTRLEFATREETIRDGLVTKSIKRVICKLGGTSSKTLDMGWCLDFGAIDWTDLSMALREFVANAIDRTVREKGDFLPALLERRPASCHRRGRRGPGARRLHSRVRRGESGRSAVLRRTAPAVPALLRQPVAGEGIALAEGRPKPERQTDGDGLQGGRPGPRDHGRRRGVGLRLQFP